MLFDQSLVLAAIACLVIVKILYSLVSIIYKSSPLNQFKNNTDKDLYAVVTGASDGIGKEFALGK